jgi:FKBP-type peptidyl-prolyl cis-trans isomerase 2
MRDDPQDIQDVTADELETTEADEVGESVEVTEGEGRQASAVPSTTEATVDGTPVQAP